MTDLTDPQWEGFYKQHDVHDLGEGKILLFDNGTSMLRAFCPGRWKLNWTRLNFGRTWQFAHPEGLYAPSQEVRFGWTMATP